MVRVCDLSIISVSYCCRFYQTVSQRCGAPPRLSPPESVRYAGIITSEACFEYTTIKIQWAFKRFFMCTVLVPFRSRSITLVGPRRDHLSFISTVQNMSTTRGHTETSSDKHELPNEVMANLYYVRLNSHARGSKFLHCTSPEVSEVKGTIDMS